MTPPEPISASSGWAKTTMARLGTSVTTSSFRAASSMGMTRFYRVRQPGTSLIRAVVKEPRTPPVQPDGARRRWGAAVAARPAPTRSYVTGAGTRPTGAGDGARVDAKDG